MAAAGATVHVTGFERTSRALARVGARAKDLRPFLEGDLTNEVHAFFAEQFASAGAAGGSPWAALRPATVRAKARRGRAGMGVLRFTNQLWASLVKRGHPLGRRHVTATSLEVGTNDPKAARHQLGLGVPRRVIAPDELPAERLARWDALVAAYVTEG